MASGAKLAVSGEALSSLVPFLQTIERQQWAAAWRVPRPRGRVRAGLTSGEHGKGQVEVQAMGFDVRDIRRSMDVYARDNVYLGTVLEVVPGSATESEEDVLDEARQSSAVNGELLGPMPTGPIGNPGPATQSARAQFGAGRDGARPIGQGAIVVGKWWGLVGRRRVPLDLVLNVSLERVVLRPSKDELERST